MHVMGMCAFVFGTISFFRNRNMLSLAVWSGGCSEGTGGVMKL